MRKRGKEERNNKEKRWKKQNREKYAEMNERKKV